MGLVAALGATGPLVPSVAAAQAPEIALEQRVKSAFLFNFAKFVEWPGEAFPDDTAPLVLGVLGDDPLAEALERTLIGKEIHGRPVRIRTFGKAETPSACHLLFVGARAAGRLPRILQSLGNEPVLIVGDSDGFADRGGTINLVRHGGETGFEINLDAAKRARLEISSRLLSLARIIRERDQERE